MKIRETSEFCNRLRQLFINGNIVKFTPNEIQYIKKQFGSVRPLEYDVIECGYELIAIKIKD